ncbi:MAG: hypothetical protein ACYC5F_09665 [Thermoleophilia bacterium]
MTKRESRIEEVKPKYKIHLRYSFTEGPIATEEELRELYEDLKELFERGEH